MKDKLNAWHALPDVSYYRFSAALYHCLIQAYTQFGLQPQVANTIRFYEVLVEPSGVFATVQINFLLKSEYKKFQLPLAYCWEYNLVNFKQIKLNRADILTYSILSNIETKCESGQPIYPPDNTDIIIFDGRIMYGLWRAYLRFIACNDARDSLHFHYFDLSISAQKRACLMGCFTDLDWRKGWMEAEYCDGINMQVFFDCASLKVHDDVFYYEKPSKHKLKILAQKSKKN